MIKEFLNFISDLYLHRRTIYKLAINDIKNRYLGSVLGLTWEILQPVTNVLILWFVFEVAFGVQPVASVPFILWLICGLIPWFFISEVIMGGTVSILQYSYLVKKVVFRSSVLPLIKLLSASFIHLILLGIVFVIFGLYGYKPTLYIIQLPYYFVLSCILFIGISWMTSSITVFIRDITQLITVLLQFGFWVTPIIWNQNVLPVRYRNLFQLNPFYYIIQGYRDCFIDHVWFWERLGSTLYCWTFTLVLFAAGALIFVKLRPHFADVL